MSKQPILQGNRRAGLDGLRGMAALVVVLHHSLLTLPWFADRVGFGLMGPKNHFKLSIHNLFEYTPLHMFYGGTEAVVIFFVLSGYVLVNPVSRESISSYVRYRLLRLYAPIFVSVTLAGGLILLFSRQTLVGGSSWMNAHAIKFTFASYFKNIWVVDGSDYLDSSLWTMRYEIIFSLAVIVLAKFIFKQSFPIFVVAMIAISVIIWVGMECNLDLLGWLPVFFAGSALHWLPEGRYKIPYLRFISGIVVLFMPWCFVGFGYAVSPIGYRILMTIGAVIIVDVCRQPSNPVSKLLSGKFPTAAGKYSYSLYLIHAPVLTTVWFVMGSPLGHEAWLLRFVIALVCITIGAAAVYQLAEKPSLKWIHSRKSM